MRKSTKRLSFLSTSTEVTFTLNRELVRVNTEEAAHKTLNEFLRQKGYTGTKVSCAQGGCGVCTVAMVRNADLMKTWKSVPSCLLPLASAHGTAILTVEGLGSIGRDGHHKPHPVQDRVAKFNGSQCGFCTPGMVMQLFATLQQGGNALNEMDLQNCINGNLCLCTGYRPIVECAKSFAKDTQVKNIFDEDTKLGPYDFSEDPEPELPPKTDLIGATWTQPSTLTGVISAVAGGARPMAGGTAFGIYSDLGVVGSNCSFVDVMGVEELHWLRCSDDAIVLGAAVTWSSFVQQLDIIIENTGTLPNPAPFRELRQQCGSIAGAQVRNSATVGGNIVITRNKGFLSDLVPLLATFHAKVSGFESGVEIDEDLLSFVQKSDEFTGLITHVIVPFPQDNLLFKAYRVAEGSRNAHALVSAGFAVALAGGEIEYASCVVGAVDPKPVRFLNLESVLVGTTSNAVEKSPSSVMSSLIGSMLLDLAPLTCAFGKKQTEHILSGFILKFLVEIYPHSVPETWISGSHSVHDALGVSEAAQTYLPRLDDIPGDIRAAMTKTAALDQTMGSALFIDDLPKVTGTLLAAYVVCPEANVEVNGVDDSVARDLLGRSFHSVVTLDDLKTKNMDVCSIYGFNVGYPRYKEDSKLQDFIAEEDMLLPFGKASHYAGQPVAVLLADSDSPRLVEMAARKMSKTLQLVRVGPPEVVDPSELDTCTQLTEPFVVQKGKNVSALINQAGEQSKSVISGTFMKKSQSHFYMENQSLICIPEENGITCHIATQCPDLCQRTISHATGLPMSNVCVKTCRVGGSFGGKVVRSAFCAAATAQMAIKSMRPIRFVIPRDTDMQWVGGRQEILGRWKAVASKKTGKISAIWYDIWLAHGPTQDAQKFNVHVIASSIDMNYSIKNWHVTMHCAKQQIPPRTETRGPGRLEAVLLIEAVIDGVAAELRKHPHEVQEANFFREIETTGLTGSLFTPTKLHDYSNHILWKNLKAKTGFISRLAEVKKFNEDNQWKKRGIALTSARYGVMLHAGSVARLDIFKDGSVQVALSGVEMGQGLHTKVGQAITTRFHELIGSGPPIDVIRFLATSTGQNPNGSPTGGSTTDELCVYSALVAVDDLAARLNQGNQDFMKPYASQAGKKLKEERHQHPTNGFWFDIISSCFETMTFDMHVPTDLSAIGMYMPKVSDVHYDTYGAAFSEVELDVLTGEAQTCKTHIMYDIGSSLNPMIDVGQVEGAFVMGLGHVMQEGVDFDHATGRCLTDNTWSYKPPLASDVPHQFFVDLVDLRSQRGSGIHRFAGECLAGLQACCGLPWKRSKITPTYKSAKCVGEPPILLAQSVHSAHMQALLAARHTDPLPDHMLPIPAKPFVTLPLLDGIRDIMNLSRTSSGTYTTLLPSVDASKSFSL